MRVGRASGRDVAVLVGMTLVRDEGSVWWERKATAR